MSQNRTTEILEDITKINSDLFFKSSIVDATGRSAFVDTFGRLAVTEKDSQITEQFCYGLPSTGVISGITGTGTLVTEDSMLKLKTTTGDGTSYAESLQAIRYIPGSMAYGYFTVYGLPQLGTAFVGIFDDEDGFAIGSLNGVPNVLKRRYNGISADTDYYAQSEWNIDKLDGTGKTLLNVDFTKGQVYAITYGYLGFACIVFSIMSPSGAWIPFHKIEYPNSSQETHISLPYLPLRAEVDNTGTGEAIEIGLGSVDAGIFNGGKTDSSSNYTAINCGDLLLTPKSTTTVDYIIAIRGKSLLGGRRNKVSSLFKSISWATDASIKGVTVDIIRDPDIVTPGTWTSFADASPLEWSSDTVFDLTTGTPTGLGSTLAKDSSRPPSDIGTLTNTLIRRDEIAVVRIESTNGTVSDMFIAMQNLF